MKSVFWLAVGLWLAPLMMSPAQGLEVPMACEALDPREPSPNNIRDAAIAIAQRQHQAGQPATAMQTLQTLVSDLHAQHALIHADSAVYHYLAIAAAAIEVGQFAPAFTWLEAAFSQVEDVHYRRRYDVMAEIAKLYAQAGDFERAWEIINAIPAPLVPDPGGVENGNRSYGRALARRYLVQAYLAQRDWGAAQATMESIEHELIQGDAQVDLASYLTNQDEFEGAIALAQDITDDFIRLDAQIAISNAYANDNQIQPAQQLLATTITEAVRKRSAQHLIEIAQVYLDWQQPRRVRRMLRLAQDYSWSAEFNYSNHRRLLDIARLYWQLDDPKETQQLLEMALGAAATRSGYESSLLKQQVVQFYLESNHQSLTRAVMLADQISDRHRRNTTLKEITEFALAQQDYQIAQFAIRQLSLPEREVIIIYEEQLLSGEPVSGEPVEESPAVTERDRWWDFVDCMEHTNR
ncbi:MAG: hypothetical protein F6J87_17635 [Spirulina sp. SIO3F2]|nr:hypothetical protein [Spirulina sp. SIO3F2]